MSRIRLDKKAPVAYFTIEGPTEENSLTVQMEDEFYELMTAFRDDRELWVAIVTGAGDKAFSIGRDLDALAKTETPEGAREQFWWPFSSPHAKLRRLMTIDEDNIEKPVIAAVNGPCLGEALAIVANCCDIRIAAEHAEFGFAETRLGIPSRGAAGQLVPQIPRAIAMYMILTGKTIDAQEAYRVGLVNKVVPQSELIATAEQIAKEICEVPPFVLKAEKGGALAAIYYPRQSAYRLSLAADVMCMQKPEGPVRELLDSKR